MIYYILVFEPELARAQGPAVAFCDNLGDLSVTKLRVENKGYRLLSCTTVEGSETPKMLYL